MYVCLQIATEGNLLVDLVSLSENFQFPKDYSASDRRKLDMNELFVFHFGCHGNHVSIVTRYEVDAYCPKKPPYQIWTLYDEDKGVIEVSLWLPW